MDPSPPAMLVLVLCLMAVLALMPRQRQGPEMRQIEDTNLQLPFPMRILDACHRQAIGYHYKTF